LKQNIRKAASFLFALAMAAGLFVLTSGIKIQAATPGEGNIPVPDYYQQDRQADNSNTAAQPTASDQGKIWTDKTVTPNGDGTFTITLSALGMQYQDENGVWQDPLADGGAVTITDTLGDYFVPADQADLVAKRLAYDSTAKTVTWTAPQTAYQGANPAEAAVSFDVRLTSGWVSDTWYETNKAGAVSASFIPRKGNPFYWTKQETVQNAFDINMNWNNGTGLNSGTITDHELGITITFGKNSSPEGETAADPNVHWDTVTINGVTYQWHLQWQKGNPPKTYIFVVKGLDNGNDVTYEVDFPGNGGSNGLPGGRTITNIDYFERSDVNWDVTKTQVVDPLDNTGEIKLTCQTGSLTVTKKVDGPADPTTPFSFTVTFSNALTSVPAGGTLSADGKTASFTLNQDQSYTIDGIPYGTTYTIQEASAADYDIPAAAAGTVDQDHANPSVAVTNVSKISVSGTKTWNDPGESYRPNASKVSLTLKDGKGDIVSSAPVWNYTGPGNMWSYSFNSLSKYDQDGNPIQYSVVEGTVTGSDPTDTYVASYNGNNIVNTISGETDVTITKTWLDNNNAYSTRPAIGGFSVTLYANSVAVSPAPAQIWSAAPGNANLWQCVFTGMPKYDVNGKLINYTVEEVPIPGYAASYSSDDRAITNTLQTVDLSGQKIWDDNNDQYATRPAGVTVQALNGSAVVASQNVTGPDWQYSFTGLPEFDNSGDPVNYTVDEITPSGYESAVSGTTITNTLDGISVSGQKEWAGDDNMTGIRPDSVTVQLTGKANGSVVVTASKSVSSPWSFVFDNLPQYDKDGSQIAYTVDEVAPAGYSKAVSGTTITNTLETTSVSGQKQWAGDENTTNIRPDSVTVRLKGEAGGNVVVTDSQIVSSPWTFAFGNLPKYDKNSNPITYTVDEDSVPGYTKSVNGATITNTLETTSVSGQKIWADNNDLNGARPAGVTVRLEGKAGGIVVVMANQTVSAPWTFAFDNLPQYDKDGNLITYSIDEDNVLGYTKSVSGTSITNTLQTTDIAGAKYWNDGGSSLRPDNVTLTLFANNEPLAITPEWTDTDTGVWSYVFKDLPVYNSHSVITYHVRESPVDNYTSTQSGNDFTNTLNKLGDAAIEGTKVIAGVTSTNKSFAFQIKQVDSDGNLILGGYSNTVSTVGNIAGSQNFRIDLSNLPVGVRYYQVTELKGNSKGWDYDGSFYTARVTISAVNGENQAVVAYMDQNGNKVDGIVFTNTYTANGSITLTAAKTANVDFSKGQFRFVVKDGQGQDVAAAANDSDGTVTFPVLTYNQDDIGKIFAYTVSEADPSGSGWQPNNQSYPLYVKVTDNDGSLLVTAYSDADCASPIDDLAGYLIFSNQYEAAGSVILTATKTANVDLDQGKFSFTVTEGGAQVATGSNTVSGSVTFSAIPYTLADLGTHTYTISEDDPGANWTADTAPIDVTVLVTDNHDGTLTAMPAYPNGGVVFHNTYSADGLYDLADLKATKTANVSLGNVQFNFVVARDGNTVATGVNDSAGNVTFTATDESAFQFTASDIGKTYDYLVSETGVAPSGWTMDKTVYSFSLTIRDNKDGTLKVEATYPTDGIVFDNTYAATGSISLTAAKTANVSLENKSFHFTVTDVTDENDVKTVASGTSNGSNIVFTTISYTLSDIGAHKYLISEDTPAAGWTADTQPVTVFVKVTDDSTGSLTAAAYFDEACSQPLDGLTFQNTYAITSDGAADVTLQGQKTGTINLIDGNQTVRVFNFSVKDETGSIVSAGANDGNGVIVFDPIQYNSLNDAGLHIYTVTENPTSLGGWTVDNVSYTIYVMVTDNGDGTLSAEAYSSYADVDNNVPLANDFLAFHNRYETANATLAIAGTKQANIGLRGNEFSFTATSDDAGAPQGNGTNDADGNFTIVFDEFTTTGTYYYTIAENQGNNPAWSYDTATYPLTVQVTDNGNGQLVASVVNFNEQSVATPTGFDDQQAGSFSADENGVVTIPGLTFHNTYKASPVSLTLTAAKKTVGKELAGGEFTFTMTDEDGNTVTAQNTASVDGNATVTFPSITYTLDDVNPQTHSSTFTYTITEDPTTLGGWVADTAVYNVVITVTDDGRGNLTTIVTPPAGDLVFTNYYAQGLASAAIGGQKVISGILSTNQVFTFSLAQVADNQGTPLPQPGISRSATITGAGNFVFSLTGLAPGIYYFRMTETGIATTGWTYDTHSCIITVTVKENGDGTASADVSYNGSTTFTNTYAGGPGPGPGDTGITTPPVPVVTLPPDETPLGAPQLVPTDGPVVSIPAEVPPLGAAEIIVPTSTDSEDIAIPTQEVPKGNPMTGPNDSMSDVMIFVALNILGVASILAVILMAKRKWNSKNR